MDITIKIIPLIVAIYVAFTFFYFTTKRESFLLRRLRSTGKKYQSWYKKILQAIYELVRPLSLENIKNIKVKNDIKMLLARVGLPSGEDDILEFENKRLLMLLGASIISAFALVFNHNNFTIILVILLIFVSYKMHEYRLNKIIAKKQKDFEKSFPDAIDLLSVCVEAGLGIDSAIERVGREFAHFSPAISVEFLRISKDVASGIPRREAFKHLSERIQSKDLQSFTALLIQSEKLGTSVAQSLNIFCDTLRSRRKQRTEELVQSSSTKMTIPMVIFLLPSLFITILYPAIIKIVENMGK